MAEQVMTGGLSGEKSADAEVQGYCDNVKVAVEKKTRENYNAFKAIAYKTQVVAGTNYFVKVHVGSDNYIELRIFRSLQGEIELAGVKEGLKADSPIVYIE